MSFRGVSREAYDVRISRVVSTSGFNEIAAPYLVAAMNTNAKCSTAPSRMNQWKIS
jgi:hypothetical protein